MNRHCLLLVMLLLTAFAVFASAASVSAGCYRGEPCWPTAGEVAALKDALEQNATRQLFHENCESPVPKIAPLSTPLAHLTDEENCQPLYGLGIEQMEPLYEDPNPGQTCQDEGLYTSGFCKAIVQNSYLNTDPDFVVFPLTAAHVQAALAFAKEHRLRVVVVGAGHDFNGRNQNHRSGGSIVIRTILMQDMSLDLDDEQGFGYKSATFGAGVVMNAVQYFLRDHQVMIPFGGCDSVGLAGYVLGGGHSQVAHKLGLGAENLLAADIVLANGEHVRADATGNYQDLYKALRGGGGSSWGVITKLIMRVHDVQPAGFTWLLTLTTGATNTAEGLSRLEHIINDFVPLWSNATTDEGFGLNLDVMGAEHTWRLIAFGLPQDVPNGALTTSIRAKMAAAFDYPPEAVISTPLDHPWTLYQLSENYVTDPLTLQAYTMVFVNREQIGLMPEAIMDRTLACPDGEDCRFVMGHFLNNNVGSAPVSGTSLGDGMRNGVIMFLSFSPTWYDADYLVDTFDSMYFNEADVHRDDPEVYGPLFWGDKYQELRETKQAYDPERIFDCRQCIN